MEPNTAFLCSFPRSLPVDIVLENMRNIAISFERLIRAFPWIIRAYFIVFILLLIVLVWAASHGSQEINGLNAKLFDLASDGIKTVLGALIGSLSLAGQYTWQSKKLEPNADEN
jgi:hypothetical protein